MTSVLSQEAVDALTKACGTEPSFMCREVFEWTGSEFWAVAADWALDRPVRILSILLAAWIIKRVLQRAVVRFTKAIANPSEKNALSQLRDRGPGRLLIEQTARARAEARAEPSARVAAGLHRVIALPCPANRKFMKP